MLIRHSVFIRYTYTKLQIVNLGLHRVLFRTTTFRGQHFRSYSYRLNRDHKPQQVKAGVHKQLQTSEDQYHFQPCFQRVMKSSGDRAEPHRQGIVTQQFVIYLEAVSGEKHLLGKLCQY